MVKNIQFSNLLEKFYDLSMPNCFHLTIILLFLLISVFFLPYILCAQTMSDRQSILSHFIFNKNNTGLLINILIYWMSQKRELISLKVSLSLWWWMLLS